MSSKDLVAFFNKGAEKGNILKWEKQLKKWYNNFKLVPLESKEAENSSIALVWKPSIDRLLRLKKLSSIISLGQGVDHIIHNQQLTKSISVYRIVDPYMAKSMSHWVILSILNYIRDYDGYKLQQKNKIYKPRKFIDFKSIKIGLYGIGEIGKVVANDLALLGFEVLGWSKTKKSNPLFKCYHDYEGFLYLNKQSDVHVCLLPLTKETENIFNRSFFSRMKSGICFINAGRGNHVVENDLLDFCQRKIDLAILDVFKNEPLEKNHPFWNQENIIIWPHVSAETNAETAAQQVSEAIKLIHSKKIPKNKVDLNLGY